MFCDLRTQKNPLQVEDDLCQLSEIVIDELFKKENGLNQL
jgi:hypothetical protein